MPSQHSCNALIFIVKVIVMTARSRKYYFDEHKTGSVWNAGNGESETVNKSGATKHKKYPVFNYY